MITAGVLLAAGRSQRFGADEKLLASLDGRPLVTHVAQAMQEAGLDQLIAVVANPAVVELLDGFHHVRVTDDDSSQADSLRAGIAEARALGVDRALVVLGDMPGVTSELLRSVVAKCTGNSPSAVTNGEDPMVPACFPESAFADLMAIEGDRGAQTMLKGLNTDALVETSAGALRDVDQPEDLF